MAQYMGTAGADRSPLSPSEFQAMADCIRSDQVPAPDVAAIMAGNPDFKRWYRARYRLDVPPG